MVFFKECNEEDFLLFEKRQKKDDDHLKKHFRVLDHKQLNFTILNVGSLLQVCAIYLELKQENIESYLKLEKEKLKKTRIETIIKELNQSINLRFGFDERIEVVEGIFIYEGESYILLNKMRFVSELHLNEKYPNF